VAITQRYFDASYFDQSLTGAQADQEVLKEIVEQKFPRLAQHLDECEIDLTTVGSQPPFLAKIPLERSLPRRSPSTGSSPSSSTPSHSKWLFGIF